MALTTEGQKYIITVLHPLTFVDFQIEHPLLPWKFFMDVCWKYQPLLVLVIPTWSIENEPYYHQPQFSITWQIQVTEFTCLAVLPTLVFLDYFFENVNSIWHFCQKSAICFSFWSCSWKHCINVNIKRTRRIKYLATQLIWPKLCNSVLKSDRIHMKIMSMYEKPLLRFK